MLGFHKRACRVRRYHAGGMSFLVVQRITSDAPMRSLISPGNRPHTRAFFSLRKRHLGDVPFSRWLFAMSRLLTQRGGILHKFSVPRYLGVAFVLQLAVHATGSVLRHHLVVGAGLALPGSRFSEYSSNGIS